MLAYKLDVVADVNSKDYFHEDKLNLEKVEGMVGLKPDFLIFFPHKDIGGHQVFEATSEGNNYLLTHSEEFELEGKDKLKSLTQIALPKELVHKLVDERNAFIYDKIVGMTTHDGKAVYDNSIIDFNLATGFTVRAIIKKIGKTKVNQLSFSSCQDTLMSTEESILVIPIDDYEKSKYALKAIKESIKSITNSGLDIRKSILSGKSSYFKHLEEAILTDWEEVDEKYFDWNVKIMKDKYGDLLYALNHVRQKEVDVIPVLFVGDNILNDNLYERNTLSYDVFVMKMFAEDYKEITPSEMMREVANKRKSEELQKIAEDVVRKKFH